MTEMLLNNLMFVPIGIFVIIKLIEWKIEYFPSKMRYYEDTYERYAYIQLYRKYRRNAIIDSIPPIKNPYVGER